MDWMDFQHLALVLGAVVSALGIAKMVRAWQEARDEATAARTRQEDTLSEIAAEFRPHNGRSLAQVVTDLEKSLHEHCDTAEKWFEANDEAHAAINRRVDGLYELFGVNNGTHRLAGRHGSKDHEEEEE